MEEIIDLTVGADPELFIINEKTNKVVSAIGLIPGEKGDPYRSKDMPEGFGLETDNIVAEFNIPPATSKEEFICSIEYMKDYINKFVKNINPNLGILCSASQMVDEDQLNSPQAQEFGCSVDYNAYTKKANPKPEGTKTNLRSCGFHLHLGYENPNIDTSLILVKYLDMYLGVPSVLRDTDSRRRSLYGKAGCFRLCRYGVEYRVLSSALMKDRESLEFIWNQLIKAIHHYRGGYVLAPSGIVRAAINDSDVELANSLIADYDILD